MKTKKPITTTLLCALLFTSLTGMASENTTSGINVYTTSSKEKVVIQSTENGTLKVVDQNGMLVMETPVYKGKNELKVSNMTAQKYILQIKTANDNVVKRLLVR